MKKRSFILIVLTFALVIAASIQPAIAYFTTYVRARGGYPVSLGDTTTIEENFSSWAKHVVIHNKEGSEPVFIRAKVIYTTKNNELGYKVSGTGWSELNEDGFYYWGTKEMPTILYGGKSTGDAKNKVNTLDVEITKIPEEPQKGDSFSVTVIYESTPVRYDANGNPYAKWDAKIIDVGSTTGGKS